MKKLLLMMACVFTVGLTFQACKSGDQKIKTDVDKVLTQYKNVTSVVNDGAVTLAGAVETQQERSTIETQVKAVKNVRAVMNNIIVTGGGMPSATSQDAMLQSAIRTSLSAAGYNSVIVSVQNGEVTLSGDLNRADLTKVMQMANEVNPSRVINNLNLK